MKTIISNSTRKFLTGALTLSMGFTLFACGGDSEKKGDNGMSPDISDIDDVLSSDSGNDDIISGDLNGSDNPGMDPDFPSLDPDVPSAGQSSSSQYQSSSSRIMTPSEEKKSFGTCTAERLNELQVGPTSKDIYRCDGKAWVVDVKGTSSSSVAKSSSSYAQSSSSRIMTPSEEKKSFGTCTEARLGERQIGPTTKDVYLCDGKAWVVEVKGASSSSVAKSSSSVGSSSSVVSSSSVNSSSSFTDPFEVIAGRICDASVGTDYASWKMNARQDTVIICDKKNGEYAWRIATIAEEATRAVCDSKLENKVIGDYACEVSGWRKATTEERIVGETCHEKKILNGYVCEKAGGSWRPASAGEAALGYFCPDDIDLYRTFKGYSCIDEGWVKATTAEIEEGFVCNATTYNELVGYDEKRDIGGYTLGKGYSATPEGYYGSRVSEKYVCDKTTEGYAWRTPNEIELASRYVCGGWTTGFHAYNSTYTKHYICKDDQWTSYTYPMIMVPASYVTKGTGTTRLYKTVKIAGATWLAQDLTYAPRNADLNTICSKGENTIAGCETRLYTQSDAKSACPTGWHLPTVLEWGTMLSFNSNEVIKTEDDLKSFLRRRYFEEYVDPDFYKSIAGNDGYWLLFGVNLSGLSLNATGYKSSSSSGVSSANSARYWTADEGKYIYTTLFSNIDNSHTNARFSLGSNTSEVEMAAVRCVKD